MMLTPGSCRFPNPTGHPLPGGSKLHGGDHSLILGEGPQREHWIPAGTTYSIAGTARESKLGKPPVGSQHTQPICLVRLEIEVDAGSPERVEHGLKICPGLCLPTSGETDSWWYSATRDRPADAVF